MRKFISVLFALVLVVSFSLIPAVPAAAQAVPNPTFATVDRDTFTTPSNEITIGWERNPAIVGEGYSAPDAIHVTTSTATLDYAIVIVPTDFTLSTAIPISYWGYTAGGDVKAPDEIYLFLDTNNDEAVDTLLTSHQPGPPAADWHGSWHEWSLTDPANDWHTADGGYTPANLADYIDKGYTVLAIALTAGPSTTSGAVDVDVYFDQLSVNGNVLLDNDTGFIDVPLPLAGFPAPSIQDAVNAALEGDTITVAPGNYTENINVNKQVTIIGAGEANTIVTAANWKDHVFEVTADGVSVSALTATGANRDSYKFKTMSGIYIDDADGCTINTVTASDNNIGIFLDHSSGSTVTGCTATNNIYRGIYLKWSDGNIISSNNASSNDVSGSWASTQSWAGIGIYLEYSANNQLTGNTANSNKGGSQYSGIGIYLDKCETGWPQLPGNVLTGNTANGNQGLGNYDFSGVGILLWQAGGTSSSKTILTGNTANGNTYAGTGKLKSGSGIVLYQTHYADVIDNTVNGNQQNGYYSEGAIGNFVHDNVVTGTTATGNKIGFYLVNDASNYTSNTVTGNTDDGVRLDSYGGMSVTATALNYNNVSGNGDYGVNNIGADLLNAEGNWWGDASGPKQAATNPCASGDEASDNVGYTPWLDAAYPGGSERDHNVENINTGSEYNCIQAAIDDAQTQARDTVLVLPGTYEETVEVDVEGLTIRSSEGPLDTTIKGHKHEGAGWWGPVGYHDIAFQVVASGVTIEGFTIDQDRSTLDDPVRTGFNRPAIMIGGWFPGDYGHLGVERVVIRDNIFNDIWSAIYIWKSSHNLIEGNIIEGCYWRSIQIYDGSSDAQLAYDPLYDDGTPPDYSNRPMCDWQGNLLTFDEGELIYPSQHNRLVDNEIASGHFGGIFVGAWPPSGGLWTDNKGTKITGNYIHDDSDIAIGTAFSSGPKALSKNIIESCRIGIYIFGDGATGIKVHWNNIVGNIEFGVLNEVPEMIDATHNWWGDASGPRDVGPGTGDAVSDYVDYQPWIGAKVKDSKSQKTGGGDVTVDATDEAGTNVLKKGKGTPTITVTEYIDNPGDGAPGGFKSAGKYIDVHIDDTTGVDEIEIRNYYTLAEVAGLNEATLKLSWWDGTAWVECSHSGVEVPGDKPAYRGYVWAIIRTKGTIPTLANLAGTAFMSMGMPPAPTVVGGGEPPVPPGTTDVKGMVSTAGVFYMSAIANSEDGICRLTIPAGTVGLTEELEPLTIITMLIMDEPPLPPKADHVIGLVYDFQPSGATFEPPITLTFNYDPGDIPEGIAEEDLVIAYYDKAAEWVNLEGTVHPETNTITALVSHFTAFTILGYEVVPEPAAFTPGSLVISLTEVDIGETVNVSLSVANTGGMAGSYKVTLKINGVVDATQYVTVGPGASETVTFTTSRDVAGSYPIDVNGLSGSFTVREKPAPAPAPAPPEVKPPVNRPLLGGIIAGVIVVGLLIFFLIRRRAY